MKKPLALFLVIIIVIACGTNLGVFAKTFPDVSTKHPNYDAVVSLTDMGVISGYEDGTFQPECEITRTEFCALMARTLGCNKETYKVKSVPFSDVKKDYWGIAFISFCYEKGLINGMGDGTFAPANKVTMVQAVKMAVCAIGKEKEALNIKGAKWYSGYVKTAEKYGLLNVVKQKADDQNAKRVNVAQVVYNMVESGLILEDEQGNPNDIVTEGPETINPDKPTVDKENETTEPVKPETPVQNPGKLPANNIPGVTFTKEEMAAIDKAFAEKDYSNVKVILVDAGHNYSGADIGARVESLGVKEEIITWQIADKLRKNLEEMGYTVHMTRNNINDNIENSTAGASLQARVDLAHKVLADLFISIHCNMGGGTGTETYCFSRGGYSSKLAELIQKKIVKATGLTNRGVKTANFYVIKNTEMPSVLVETGFLDRARDREILLSEEGQNAIAKAIAEAVKEYDELPSKSKSAATEQTDENTPVAAENSEEDMPLQ